MNIDIFQPLSKKEELMAQAMEAFSTFVLHEEPVKCHKILLEDDTGSVGELQGGNHEYSIYRVSLESPPSSSSSRRRGRGGHDVSHTTSTTAADLLLQAFHASPRGKRYQHVMTISNLTLYLLAMCQRRSRERTRVEKQNDSGFHRQEGQQYHDYTLSNPMLILQFGGPTHGQVRHIDSMTPNIQICLYMSTECPSTILYSMEGEVIENTQMMLDHWIHEEGRDVPYLVQYILEEMGNACLASMWYTKYFGFWGNMNSMLKCFGKLYQSVSFQYSWVADPGTVLLAGGNEVHAGPPTCGPRMFAFAVGVPPDESTCSDAGESGGGGRVGDGNSSDNDHCAKGGDYERNGEVQYSPVLLHLDVCCVMFSIMDHDPDCILKQGQSWHSNDGRDGGVVNNDDLRRNGKLFLIELLIELVRDYPMRDYLLQIDVKREGLRTWLEKLLDAVRTSTTHNKTSSTTNVHSNTHHQISPTTATTKRNQEIDNNNDDNRRIVAKLVEEAITSHDIFHCSLEVQKYRDVRKKRQRGQRRNKHNDV